MAREMERWLAGAAALLVASAAAAQTRGMGSGKSSAMPSMTKGSSSSAERAARPSRPPDFDPRPGYMGGMGAAPEAGGPLGPRSDVSQRPSYGEGAQRGSSGGESYQTWKSGDVVRSWSANDVRAARVQQAPDLEWAGSAGSDQGAQTYGKKFQEEQGRRRR